MARHFAVNCGEGKQITGVGGEASRNTLRIPLFFEYLVPLVLPTVLIYQNQSSDFQSSDATVIELIIIIRVNDIIIIIFVLPSVTLLTGPRIDLGVSRTLASCSRPLG